MSETCAHAAAASESVVKDVALTLFAERGSRGTALSHIAEVLGIRTPEPVQPHAVQTGPVASDRG